VHDGHLDRVQHNALIRNVAGQDWLDDTPRQGYLVRVEVADSARKHGVREEDINHALRNPLQVIPGEGRDLIIGADRAGQLLEVVVLDDDLTKSRS